MSESDELIHWCFAGCVDPNDGETVLVKTRRGTVLEAYRSKGHWYAYGEPPGPMRLPGHALFWAPLPKGPATSPRKGAIGESR